VQNWQFQVRHCLRYPEDFTLPTYSSWNPVESRWSHGVQMDSTCNFFCREPAKSVCGLHMDFHMGSIWTPYGPKWSQWSPHIWYREIFILIIFGWTPCGFHSNTLTLWSWAKQDVFILIVFLPKNTKTIRNAVRHWGVGIVTGWRNPQVNVTAWAGVWVGV